MSAHQQNFWDFLNSFDPNSRAGPGQGVDHNAGFPFPGGFFPFGGGAGPHGHARPHPPGAWPWGAETDFDDWNPWVYRGPRGRRGGRHGHGYRWGGEGHPRRGREAPAQAQDTTNSGPDTTSNNNANDRSDSETMRAESNAVPDPDVVVPDAEDTDCSGRCHGRRRGHGPRGPHHAHPHEGHHRGPGAGDRHPPPYPGFDFPALLRVVGNHPIVQSLREHFPEAAAAAAGGATNNDNTANDKDNDGFAPPVDTFNTESAYILHVALPGARKEDVGVNWDGESRTLHIAGVVHRPGDEAFLATLQGSGERTVGLFERKVALPGNDEVDGMAISAKMEDGILMVTVPKVEKEWTEIHKVDIM